MIVACIDRVNFNLDEDKHTVSYSRSACHFAKLHNDYTGWSTRFKAVVADTYEMVMDLMREQLVEAIMKAGWSVSDFSYSFVYDNVEDGKFWLRLCSHGETVHLGVK